jgi:hypothetical protein
MNGVPTNTCVVRHDPEGLARSLIQSDAQNTGLAPLLELAFQEALDRATTDKERSAIMVEWIIAFGVSG